jgi:hypothetical protein
VSFTQDRSKLEFNLKTISDGEVRLSCSGLNELLVFN